MIGDLVEIGIDSILDDGIIKSITIAGTLMEIVKKAEQELGRVILVSINKHYLIS